MILKLSVFIMAVSRKQPFPELEHGLEHGELNFLLQWLFSLFPCFTINTYFSKVMIQIDTKKLIQSGNKTKKNLSKILIQQFVFQKVTYSWIRLGKRCGYYYFGLRVFSVILFHRFRRAAFGNEGLIQGFFKILLLSQMPQKMDLNLLQKWSKMTLKNNHPWSKSIKLTSESPFKLEIFHFDSLCRPLWMSKFEDIIWMSRE